jgi:TonB family protein
MKNKALLFLALFVGLLSYGQNKTNGTEVSPEYSINQSDFIDKPYTFDIRAEVLNKQFVVFYTLKSEFPSDIFLYASYDKGSSWNGPMEKVTGDVGHSVTEGSNKIFWDCMNEKGFDVNAKGVVFKVETTIIHPEENKPLAFVQEMPVYPGGEKALYEFLYNNITYPELEKSKGIQGTVYVNFVVEKDGTPTSFIVTRGIAGGPGLDLAALNACKAIGRFKPGSQNGNAQRVFLTIPIKFTLSEPEKIKK